MWELLDRALSRSHSDCARACSSKIRSAPFLFTGLEAGPKMLWGLRSTQTTKRLVSAIVVPSVSTPRKNGPLAQPGPLPTQYQSPREVVALLVLTVPCVG